MVNKTNNLKMRSNWLFFHTMSLSMFFLYYAMQCVFTILYKIFTDDHTQNKRGGI